MEKLQQLEKKLFNIAQEIYQLGERRIKPTFPWVLIRAVPKEQIVGGIVLAENAGTKQQHKPLAEGIVIATWEPNWGPKVIKNDKEQEQIWRESEFEPGDRILYPHFAGLPVNFLDDRNYRLVREWTYDPSGGIMCHVSYDGDRKYRDGFDQLFSDLNSITLSGR